MKIAVPRETAANERRVSMIPETIGPLVKSGIQVLVESGAGAAAFFSDRAYSAAGASVVPGVAVVSAADIVVKVQKPSPEEAAALGEGSALICFLQPSQNPELLKQLAERKVTSFSMDAIPRIARAQSMDALSSMSSLAGYKAALIAADSLPRFFPLLMTAAGTVPPARVLVLGAGVAGLQAIATARRLGAIVQAFDTRPIVKEQVESLGATFLQLGLEHQDAEAAGGYAKALPEEVQRRERELIGEHVATADVVITTALVPGKRAPILITEDMVRNMRAGSVIVDLAAEQGGNCALTEPGRQTVHDGITIHGALNLAGSMPVHASQLYSRNTTALLRHLLRDNALRLDFNDEITRSTCITHEGRILYGDPQP